MADATTVNINSISDKELFRILNSLPMQDLMRCERVCQRWQSMHQIVCRNIKALFLYVPTYRYELTHYPEILHWSNLTFDTKFTDFALCVHCKSLTKPLCAYLLEKFPNVKQFNLFGVQITVEDLAFMLQQWA